MATNLPPNANGMPMGQGANPPDASMEKIPDILPDEDIDVDVAAVIYENTDNYADNKAIAEEVKKELDTRWSNIFDRSTYEQVWDTTDLMYRVKPPSSVDEKNRANFGCGVYNRSINQLTSMAFQVIAEGMSKYKFIPRPTIADEGLLQHAKVNAEILTDLLHIAMKTGKFKKQLRKILFSVFKYGTTTPAIPFRKTTKQWRSGKKKTTYSVPELPIIEHIPIENVYADANIDGIEQQQAIFIKDPKSWTELKNDKSIILPKEEWLKGLKANKKAVDKYPDSGNETTDTVKQDRFANAGHDYTDTPTGLIQHWVVWAYLPIDTEKDKWDDTADHGLFKIRIVGDPAGNCEIIECRENIFPDGHPMLVIHQAEDDIGFYHISLAEKVETYHNQLCVAQNQLADNRSKINRRPIFYNDSMLTHTDRIAFGHSTAIPVEGDPNNIIKEAEMLDITQTIMTTIIYNENKIKEIMNTVDAVLGQAMGGRTTKTEYQGAQTAASTPIYADLAVIEEDMVVGYMDKFVQYIHAFFTRADIIYFVGESGRNFDFQVTGKDYSVVAEGVVYARDKAMKKQDLFMLLQVTQDRNKRLLITKRIADTTEIENTAELLEVPPTLQAEKAAMWENYSMLTEDNFETPQQGEDYDVHLPIHQHAYMEAKREKNPRAANIGLHIRDTMNLKQQEQSAQGTGLLSAIGQQTAQSPDAAVPAQNVDMPEMQQAESPMPA